MDDRGRRAHEHLNTHTFVRSVTATATAIASTLRIITINSAAQSHTHTSGQKNGKSNEMDETKDLWHTISPNTSIPQSIPPSIHSFPPSIHQPKARQHTIVKTLRPIGFIDDPPTRLEGQDSSHLLHRHVRGIQLILFRGRFLCQCLQFHDPACGSGGR